ncbi:TPA: hypothetical protein N0F65_000729 [Lagenidium giganteum]|uniref:Uncharacterized protein n=1 Tax=Lagenidium giganteum TaxID=4803 RepID=A0AAV2ZG98_9STRA|nr:TPA: hypothetical protein N0F65_000729 [Lagenidium giganteum]
MFNCHMNVEISSSIQSVKYLYKYVYKGHDRVQANVEGHDNDRNLDETRRFVDARYVSASEAFWRIMDFKLQWMQPSVMPLQVHLEDRQHVVYDEDDDPESVLDENRRTTLTEWMTYNREHPHDSIAKQTLYGDFPSLFTWKMPERQWFPRGGQTSVGRMHFVNPRDVERYHLRLLLNHAPGAISFQDLRTVDGEVQETFLAAARARRLLQSDEEFDQDLQCAVTS